MKLNNTSYRSPEQLKFKPEDANAIEPGITRRLLEKYRSKHLHDMEKASDKDNIKRVA